MNPAGARAKTKITVQSSEAKPYETTSPKLVEIHISEKFCEIWMANHRFGLYRSNATISPPAWSASTIQWKTGRTPGHLRASRFRNLGTARSRLRVVVPDRGQ